MVTMVLGGSPRMTRWFDEMTMSAVKFSGSSRIVSLMSGMSMHCLSLAAVVKVTVKGPPV